MKLSEALRMGEFALEPVHGVFLHHNEKGDVCGGCAIGRACYAAGFRAPQAVDQDDEEWLEEFNRLSDFFDIMWPWTLKEKPRVHRQHYWRNPAMFYGTVSERQHHNAVLCDISNLYENECLGIQDLADWVEQFEPHEESHDATQQSDTTTPHQTGVAPTVTGVSSTS